MNSRQATITQHFTRAVIRAIESGGRSIPDNVLVMLDEFEDSPRIPMSVQDQVWKELSSSFGESGFGLWIGERIEPGSLDVVGFLLMSCDTLEEALEALVTYHPLISEGGEFMSTAVEGGIQLIYSPFFEIQRAERVEAVQMALVNLSRYLTFGKASPKRVNFSHQPLAVEAAYNGFSSEVCFGQAVDSIVFDRETLELKLSQSNALVNDQLKQMADANLQAIKKLSTIQQVSEFISADPALNKDQVAEKLNISSRHLNRLLSVEGTTFKDLANREKEKLAKQKLMQEVSIYGIALELGFGDESAFSKAFKRWTGVSPSQYRQTIK